MNKITVTLTKDQIRYLQGLVMVDIDQLENHPNLQTDDGLGKAHAFSARVLGKLNAELVR